jgi:cytochrome c biogenesis protein CcdA
VTFGFIITFVAIGLFVISAGGAIYERVPWITIVIGLFLIGIGVALVSGRQFYVRLPLLERGGRTRGFGSMVVFGISYAIASLGCTLPTFLGAASGVLRGTDIAGGVRLFVAYAIGMGLVLTGVTVAVALARHSLVRQIRRILPYVQRVAGVILIFAGAYVAWYGWYEIRVFRNSLTRDPVVDAVTDVFDQLRAWAIDIGGVRLAALLAGVIGGAVVVAVAGRRRRAGPAERGAPQPSMDRR